MNKRKLLFAILSCLIYGVSYAQLVTEETKDKAYLAPTSLITAREWFSKPVFVNWETVLEYGSYTPASVSYYYKFYKNGTYFEKRRVVMEVGSTEDIFEISLMGKWTRYLKEFLCTKEDTLSIKVGVIKYRGVLFSQLSERKKMEATREFVSYGIKMRHELHWIATHRSFRDRPYPNTSFRNSINRLDEDYLIIGDKVCMSREKHIETKKAEAETKNRTKE